MKDVLVPAGPELPEPVPEQVPQMVKRVSKPEKGRWKKNQIGSLGKLKKKTFFQWPPLRALWPSELFSVHKKKLFLVASLSGQCLVRIPLPASRFLL